MNLVNHEPTIRVFVNGMQITFPNKYTVLIKTGPGTKSTQSEPAEDTAELFMASRFGTKGNTCVQVEVYDPAKNNITIKFGEAHSLGYINTIELVNILYIVSNFSSSKLN